MTNRCVILILTSTDMAAKKYVQSQTLYLAGSGVLVGATNIVLTSLTDIYGNAITSITSFGDKGYITLEPDTSNEEGATFTSVIANANGTVTLGGVSTILAQSPYTETSGLIRAHSGGTKVTITDNVAFWNTFTNKNNDETITGQWTFNVFPITPSNSDASTTVKGVTKLSVAPASPTAPIAVGDNDTRVPAGYGVDAVGTDAYAITLVNVPTAYVAGIVYMFKAQVANSGPATLNVNALGAKTIKNRAGADLNDNDILAGQVVLCIYDGTNMRMVGGEGTKFGGTGVDGALSITSGTTTISAASAQTVVKNYASISITGTGALAFSTPHANGTTIILKSQGNVTLTSSATPMIDASGMGAIGGVGVSGSGVIAGNDGSDGIGYAFFKNNHAVVATNTAGAAATVIPPSSAVLSQYSALYPWLVPGSGGSSAALSGGTGSYHSGNAGRGGGALVIECGGAWNFTTTNGISVAGTNPATSGVDSAGNSGVGGSSGGSGGTFIGLYNTLVSNSGTVNKAGGTGAVTAPLTSGSSGGAPSGGSLTNAGSAGTSQAANVKSGADGATGYSLIESNDTRI